MPVLGAFDDPLEYDDLDNNQAPNGDESEDELERRLAAPLPSIREVRAEIGQLVGARYYSVTVDDDRGLEITYLRTTRINSNRALVQNAKKNLTTER